MKGKYVILTSALLVSVASFAQKDEIKAAEKAFKKGQAQEAVGILNGAEGLIANASDSEKAQYYYVKGNALLELANNKVEEDKNLSAAATSYINLIAAEKASGKAKYAAEATKSITAIKYKLINNAIADSKVDKHAASANKLYDAYLLDKKDTLNLYYAASTYINAKDYDNALKLYGELKDMNYSGKATNYLAVNKITNESDLFATVQERDRMIKLGTHIDPTTEEIPSKRGEIYKNIALILVQNGKTAEAKEAIAAARKSNPEDTSLILTEANLYLETKDFETYKKLITEALAANPNDADLLFNLGVVSSNAKNIADAEKYYTKALEINPKYLNAYINMAALKLEKEGGIIAEMNKLTNSDKDMKRYDVLKKQREDLFRAAIPYLQKSLELEPKNADVAKTLLGVYSALEMTAEKKALEAKM
ncbi:tetratricopeptide repeat protein [Flavobacterium frigidarium]|jgi:tetratricopeptide (TPR) repeat protein|uniref:tetratricopeptide repeat protein n=1 Tax=Flavobacterium frigidarium TaxID=99286 RepID=UPI0030DA1E36|tara:strand:+ start:6337 stop:7605 length:1269 start_codon:yes stop_codon:yes gene_type:complete